MPGQNELWEKYGCYICNNYPLFVLTADFSTGDTKQDVINWCNDNNVQYPACYHAEGGADFNIVLDNNNYGGPKYWIKPDKTFKSYSSSDVTNAGIQEHICGTHITHELDKDKISNNISFLKVTKNGFSVDVLKDGVYSISFYSAKGQLKTMVSERFLSAGSHQLSFEKGKLANGVYFVEVRNGKNVTRQKVIIE